MNNLEFANLKAKYTTADTDEKIRLYTETQGLSEEQYRDLLLLFPRKDLNKLEKALG